MLLNIFCTIGVFISPGVTALTANHGGGITVMKKKQHSSPVARQVAHGAHIEQFATTTAELSSANPSSSSADISNGPAGGMLTNLKQRKRNSLRNSLVSEAGVDIEDSESIDPTFLLEELVQSVTVFESNALIAALFLTFEIPLLMSDFSNYNPTRKIAMLYLAATAVLMHVICIYIAVETTWVLSNFKKPFKKIASDRYAGDRGFAPGSSLGPKEFYNRLTTLKANKWWQMSEPISGITFLGAIGVGLAEQFGRHGDAVMVVLIFSSIFLFFVAWRWIAGFVFGTIAMHAELRQIYAEDGGQWRACLIAATFVIIMLVVCEVPLVSRPWFDMVFFENDERYSYPYVPDTIPDPLLLSLCAVIYVIYFFGHDFKSRGVGIVTAPGGNSGNSNSSNKRDSAVLVKSIHWARVFPYSLMAQLLAEFLADFIKLIVGRPRPCLFSYCQYEFVNSPSNQAAHMVQTEANKIATARNFPETITGKSDEYFKDHPKKYVGNYPNPNLIMGDYSRCQKSNHLFARCSFLSGHSCLIFASFYFLYLDSNNPLIRAFSIAIAFMVAISRVMDYKHHFEDVIAGALLGCCLAQLLHSHMIRKFFFAETDKRQKIKNASIDKIKNGVREDRRSGDAFSSKSNSKNGGNNSKSENKNTSNMKFLNIEAKHEATCNSNPNGNFHINTSNFLMDGSSTEDSSDGERGHYALNDSVERRKQQMASSSRAGANSDSEIPENRLRPVAKKRNHL